MIHLKLPTLILAGTIAAFSANAQTVTSPAESTPTEIKSKSFFQQYNVLNNLELGVTAGTTGIGFEIASPVTEWAKVRAGFDFTPSFDVPMHFGITTYTDGAVNSGNFEKIKNLMYSLSGYEMDDVIDVNGSPKMTNFKFLVDLYPLRDKHWHFTVGFYSGPKRIATAINTMTEMPSLLAIGMYNRLYDYAINDGFIDNPIYNDIYLDPDQADMLKEKLQSYGRIGIHIGDYNKDVNGHKKGDPYYMEPGKDGTVKAKAYVNSFKYYLGFGYGGAMSKDKRWNVSFDAGAMFWGGSPKVINHEGVDMASDLENVRGKVGDYLEIIDALKVYPVINVKFSYTFF